MWHAHRWQLLVAIVVVPVLAVMVHSAVAGSNARALREPWPMVPTVEPSPISSSPGCHMLPGSDRGSPAPVRVAEPARRLPFFAARSGRLPASGTPVVGGVRLPAGSRCGPFWSTDAGVPDASKLARKLAAVFPSTGLWPLLVSEEPDAYVNGGGDVERVDSLDAEKILRRAWHGDGPFPGLAAAEPAEKRLAVEPFGDVLEQSLMVGPSGGPILMLVPVNRPADVLAVLHPNATIYFGDHALSAVLRSWEERFGGVVTTFTGGAVDLVVGAPPRDGEQIERLVAEHLTFAPDLWGAAELRAMFRKRRPLRGTTTAHYWSLGWPD